MAVALIPLLLPAIPGLIVAVMDVVDRFKVPDGTPEEQKIALAKLVSELHEVNAKVQAAPLPGDTPPAA